VSKFTEPHRLFFYSTHLYDVDKAKDYTFYPGSGDTDDSAHNVINVPIAPLWRSREVAKVKGEKALKEDSSDGYNTRRARKEGVEGVPGQAAAEAAAAAAVAAAEAARKEKEREQELAKKEEEDGPIPPQYLVGAGRDAYRQAIESRCVRPPAARAHSLSSFSCARPR
jgi:hypothetical protein